MTKGLFTQDVTRITLAVIFIAVLIASCFWIMRPFLSAIIWATMIVIATWPLLLSMQARLGGRRGVAVLIMTLLLLAILFVPLSFAAILAAKTVRGVAIGGVGTTMIQSLLGGIGLLISGIPAVVILSAVMLLLCVAQLGPGLVLIPATIWLFTQGETGWGIFMVVWTLFVGTMDNFLRPVLIKRGADLPLVLIFAGVIGGLLSFGVIGLFIGPVMLAVTYTLLKEWVVPEAAHEQVVTSE